MRRACKDVLRRSATGTLGLVPTMGALHAGHVSLVQTAKSSCDFVAASIFINPLQFAPHEDFSKYPRTFDSDCELLERERVDLLFAPTAAEMYPANMETFVDVPLTGGRLDGASRPGHFRGVATVVAKLFHIVQPDRAFFGQKDAAQIAVLRRMVQDLNFDVEIVVCPTVRDDDGLALSSRNHYLDLRGRESALALSRSLRLVERMIEDGEHAASRLREAMHRELQAGNDVAVDYAAIVDAASLLPVEDTDAGALVAVAAWVGNTRLIDNLVIPPGEMKAER